VKREKEKQHQLASLGGETVYSLAADTGDKSMMTPASKEMKDRFRGCNSSYYASIEMSR